MRMSTKGRFAVNALIDLALREAAGAGQAALFSDGRQEKLRNLSRAADGIREKFGKAALSRARLLPPRTASGEDREGTEDGAAEASSAPGGH